jgi:DNA-directed RNA polymerase subunit E'/Rpb7
MFALSQIEHDLPMPPHLLSRPLPDAIKAELERLFLDKVTRMLVPFSRGISIVEKILLGMPAILALNPFAHNIGGS